MPESIVVDLDDFQDCHVRWALPLFDRLHAESGGRFRATLFTIPTKTGPAALAAAAERPWLELAVHGWTHEGPECAYWDAGRTQEVLKACGPPYVPVFKAPHWMAAPGVYVALRDAGWAIADHPRNALTIPRGLRRYVLAPDHRIGVPHLVLPVVQAHGHFTNEGGVGNGLRECLELFRGLAQWDLPYKFVSEVVA